MAQRLIGVSRGVPSGRQQHLFEHPMPVDTRASDAEPTVEALGLVGLSSSDAGSGVASTNPDSGTIASVCISGRAVARAQTARAARILIAFCRNHVRVRHSGIAAVGNGDTLECVTVFEI